MLLGAVLAVVFTALEVREPIFRTGPVGFTTSELAAGFFVATVVLWGMGRGASRLLARRPLDAAVLIFLASNFLSTVFADDHGSTLKFSLRMTYAALLYFAVSRMPRQRRSHRVIAGALMGTIAAVCLVGLLEGLVTGLPWHEILAPFRQETVSFFFFYNVRASSTLPFPTIFSFYLELAAPVVIAAGIWMMERQPTPGRRRLALLATLVLIGMIVMTELLTFTRSAYVVSPVSLAIGAAVAALYGYGRRVTLTYLFGAVLLVALLGTAALVSTRMSSRLGLSEPPPKYGAEYTLLEMPASMEPGQKYVARVRVKNTGSDKWKTAGKGGAELVTRWLDYPGGEMQDVPYQVIHLPQEVEPGQEVELEASFITPKEPGRYLLDIELAAVSVDFFSGTGVPSLIVPLRFDQTGGSRFDIPESPAAFNSKGPPPMSVSRPQLWRAALKAWRDHPLVGLGPDQFRRHWVDYIPGAEPDERLGSHNIFLEAAANTGLVGLLALLYLLARNAWLQFGVVRERNIGRELRLLALGLLVSSTVYIGHGMFEYPLWQTGVTFLLFTLLGLTSLLAAEEAAEGGGGDGGETAAPPS
jgi:O-antigen ligase